MTRKHFEKLAAALRATKPEPAILYAYHSSETIAALILNWKTNVEAVVTACASENDRFNRARFLEACGMTPEVA